MKPVVYLHIGAPKTGTTYLQRVLWNNRAALRADGVLYPGRTFADHVHAAFDLRGTGFHGYRDAGVPGAWTRLLREARGWHGTVVISQELFSPAMPRQVDRAMNALSFAEVHIVYTARDLVRQIPAAWQEDIKNGFTLGFAEFLDGLRAPHRACPAALRFWRMQDAVDVLGRWARGVPPQRVHLVTVPPSGAPPGRLWERFAGVVGLDPRRYDTAIPGANPSLGAVEATLLRRVNLALDNSVPWPVYSRVVKHHLAKKVLAGRPDPVKIELPASAHEWALTRSKELVEGLRGGGHDVVGDLDELIPGPVPVRVAAVDDVAEEQQLPAAVDGAVELLRRIARVPDENEPLARRVRELEAELARRRRHPVRTVVSEIGARLRPR